MKQAKARDGVKVIIARQTCVITARKMGIRRGCTPLIAEACTGCETWCRVRLPGHRIPG